MAQTGFPLFEDGQAVMVENDSTTSAITAGDILYSIANDNVLGATAANVRGNYGASDIKVKAARWSSTGFEKPIGIAEVDIPASGKGSCAFDGIWAHPAAANVEAGQAVQAVASTNKVTVLSSTTAAEIADYKIGRALTGATADTQYLIWRANFEVKRNGRNSFKNG